MGLTPTPKDLLKKISKLEVIGLLSSLSNEMHAGHNILETLHGIHVELLNLPPYHNNTDPNKYAINIIPLPS